MASGEAYTTLAHADRAVATIIESVTSKVIDEGQFLILRREHWEEIKSRLTAMRIPELGDMIRLIEGAQL